MAHEVTKSFNIDGRETLIPTVLDGVQLSDDDALAALRDGRIKSLGEFDTPEEATAFAEARSGSGDVNIFGNPIPNIVIGGPKRDMVESGDAVLPPDDDFGPGYAATREATETQDVVDAADREFGPAFEAEEAEEEKAQETAREKPKQPTLSEAMTEGGPPVADAVLRDIGRGALELPAQVLGGLRDAAQETMEFVDSVAVWLNTHVADLTVFDPETAPRFDLPEVAQAETVTGGVSRGILQFIFGMIGAGKVTGLSKLKKLSKVGDAGRLGLQGAIADAIARDPNEENLANLIRELSGDQQNAVLNFMSSDPDDSEAVARLKKSVEGFGVGALVDGLILGLGALRASRGLRTAAAAGAGGTALTARASEAEGALTPQDATVTPATGGASTKGAQSQDVDPLTQDGAWRDVTVTATLDNGDVIEVRAGEAMDQIACREEAANKLMDCVNAA